MHAWMKRILLPCFLVLAFLCLVQGVLVPCDTWVALPDATQGGWVLLGKNSDRPLFDCQPLFFRPRRTWPEGAVVKLERLELPQATETYAVLGSSPYWCYGFEEGINEFGVAIGNEGIATRVLAEERAALMSGKSLPPSPTGMDLLRLGLERGRTAREALHVITSLLERYGQAGSGLPGVHPVLGAYHNAYIIADPKEAWILETAGRTWAAKRIAKGTASISNTLSLGTDWDLAGEGMEALARKKGWWKETKGPVDFTRAFLDITPLGAAQRERSLPRAACSARRLAEHAGKITVRTMTAIARDRSSLPEIDQDMTASSCVAQLPAGSGTLPVFWWCAATPSNSCYVPFFVNGSRLPDIVTRAGTHGKSVEPPESAKPDAYAPNSFWWIFRKLSDETRAAYGRRNPIVRATFDPLEAAFAKKAAAAVERAVALRAGGRTKEAAALLDACTATCVEEAVAAARGLCRRFEEEPVEVPARFMPYIGSYEASSGPLAGKVFHVRMQNDRLAVVIPDQGALELEEPGQEKKWYARLSKTIAVSFDLDDQGRAKALHIHQAGMTFTLLRK